MGTIKESIDPDMKFPSSYFFGSDIPQQTGILLDDICETIIVRYGDEVEIYPYDSPENE